MTPIPPVLWQYIQGLRAHDLAMIAATIANEAEIVLPTRKLTKSGFLAFLSALYAAFPDWNYRHDAPESRGPDQFAVKWYQSGTHTAALDLPELARVAATGKLIRIPEQFFFYRVVADQLIEIRPDAIPGGAPWGILEQLGVAHQ